MKAKHYLRSVLVILAFLSIALTGCQKELNDFTGVNPDPNGTSIKVTGALGTVNCGSAIVNGKYTKGVALNSTNTVVLTVNVTSLGAFSVYTPNSNGCSFAVSGTFTTLGSQSVTLLGTGTPSLNGVASYPVSFAGATSCAFNVVVVKGDPIYQTSCGTTYVYYEVANQKTLKTWLDRNLGASQVAQSPIDYLAYGSLYQWGRLSDNHQGIVWEDSYAGTPITGTTATKSATDVPGHGNFITSTSNWRTIFNNNLWQGTYGVNNPCPLGYRIPTAAEFNAEKATWTAQTPEGAYGSPMKWVIAGYREGYDGTVTMPGYAGCYWSSTRSSPYASQLYFDEYGSVVTGELRANGCSVRPIKN